MSLSDLAAICVLFCGNGDDDDDEEKADTDAEHRVLGHSATKLGGCNCTRFFPNKLSNLSVIIAKLRHYFMMCVPLGIWEFFQTNVSNHHHM